LHCITSDLICVSSSFIWKKPGSSPQYHAREIHIASGSTGWFDVVPHHPCAHCGTPLTMTAPVWPAWFGQSDIF
jgi:hypothetical protein